MSKNTIIVTPSQAFGDIIETTRVLNSIHATLPKLEIKVKVKEDERRQLLEGYSKTYGGFVSDLLDVDLLDVDYRPASNELKIDLTRYQDELPNHLGFHYTEAMLRMAEKQLSIALREQIVLTRGAESKLIFPEEKFKQDIESGKRKLEEILKQNHNKQIIWLGTRTAGSENRMPQSCYPAFWEDLIEELSDNYSFYEKRAPNEAPIHQEVYPKQGESLSLVAESEIIKASTAGIGIDGMQIHLAYALGKERMIVLLGPTHPNAVIYPGADNTILTIPDLEAFKNSVPCSNLGLHGYIHYSKYPEIKDKMKKYYPNYEFNNEIEEALRENSQDKLNNAVKTLKCPRTNCCFSQLTIEGVIERLESLIMH